MFDKYNQNYSHEDFMYVLITEQLLNSILTFVFLVTTTKKNKTIFKIPI